MSTTTISHSDCAGMVRRPAVDVLAEKVARSLLAWTNRRQQVARPSHDRVALLRANEQLRLKALAASGHSPLPR